MKRKIVAILMILTMLLSISAFALEGETESYVRKETPLMAVKGREQVGSVFTWDDGKILYIYYVLDECKGWTLESTHVHIQDPNREEQAMKAHNYTKNHIYETDVMYEIPFDCDWDCRDELMIAAHAVLVKKVCETVTEPGDISLYSTTGGSVVVKGEPDTDAVLAYDPGDECDTYYPDYWDSQLKLDSIPFAFDSDAKWIWESEYVKSPVAGDIVEFQTEFEIEGIPAGGMLQAACDNGMAVYLNGELLGTANLPLFPNLGDLTESYVPTSGWHKVQEYDLSGYLQKGINTLEITGVNEQMDRGTICLNPAGLKFQLEAEWEGIEECCCIRSAAWAYEKRCPKSSWATYYTYYLCPCIDLP